MRSGCFIKRFGLLFWLLFQISFTYSQAKLQRFSKGEIIDSVICITQNNQSYALYLPVEYDTARKWPVLFIFDPAARGRLGASVFKDGAERFGYLLLCSNNSSNKSVEGSYRAAEAIIGDAIKRYSVDTSRMYTAGFSGGSRFALRFALKNSQIKGVIGCGAGLPNETEPVTISQQPLYYYGIVGNRDLNLQDLIKSHERISELGAVSHLQIVEGGHMWPPEEELTLALAWLNIMGGGAEDSIVRYYTGARMNQVDEFLKNSNYLDAVLLMESLTAEFPSFGEKEDIELLKQEKLYKKQEKARSAAYQRELQKRELYFNAFAVLNYSTPVRPDTVYTPQWWKREVQLLKRWENSRNIETSLMGSRLLNMIEIYCAESLWSYVVLEQNNKALFILDLWMLVTPDKLWADWNAAKLYAALGERKRALQYVQKVVLSGVAKQEWFNTTPEFESLRSDPGFLELMKLVE